MGTEQVLTGGQLCQFCKQIKQILPISQLGAFGILKKERVFIAGLFQSFTGTGEARRIDQPIIFQKPGKHTAEHPGSGDLRDEVVQPLFKSMRGPLGVFGFLILGAQPFSHLGHFRRTGPFQQVGFQFPQQRLQIG